MLVAVSLFVLVVFISLGALLSIFDANRRSQSSKTVVDNLNFTIDDMARKVRFGTNYHGCTTSDLDDPRNCSQGASVLAVDFEGDIITYRFCNGGIKRSITSNGEADCNDSDMNLITSPETVITDAKFYVFGTQSSDSIQPYVIALIRGYVGNKATAQSSFVIETVMSQRKLDI